MSSIPKSAPHVLTWGRKGAGLSHPAQRSDCAELTSEHSGHFQEKTSKLGLCEMKGSDSAGFLNKEFTACKVFPKKWWNSELLLNESDFLSLILLSMRRCCLNNIVQVFTLSSGLEAVEWGRAGLSDPQSMHLSSAISFCLRQFLQRHATIFRGPEVPAFLWNFESKF